MVTVETVIEQLTDKETRKIDLEKLMIALCGDSHFEKTIQKLKDTQ